MAVLSPGREFLSCYRFWQSLKELRNIAVAAPLPRKLVHAVHSLSMIECLSIFTFLASALEASTSLPRNSTSFWQLAFTAESSAAHVTLHAYIHASILLIATGHDKQEEVNILFVLISGKLDERAFWSQGK